MSSFGLIRGFRSSDSTAQPLRLDKATDSIQTIEYEHHEIHAGSSFTVSYKADIGNGANLDVILITPNTTKWPHLTYEFDCEAETDINIYEGATTGTGTTITIYNRDRNSATTSSCIAQSGPLTVTTGTTVIRSYHLGAGKSFGGGARGAHEFVLKQNTKYLFRMTNATTLDNYMSLKLDFYEHTNIA